MLGKHSSRVMLSLKIVSLTTPTSRDANLSLLPAALHAVQSAVIYVTQRAQMGVKFGMEESTIRAKIL